MPISDTTKRFWYSTAFIGAFAAYTFFLANKQQQNQTLTPISNQLQSVSQNQTRTGVPITDIPPRGSRQSISNTPAAQTTPVNKQPKKITPAIPKGQFADGGYTGDSIDVFYGFVQVKAVVLGGKLTDVIILKSPNDRQTSIEIASQSLPYLKQEAIISQSANVDMVSGATETSAGFIKSLASALAQAKI